MYILPYYDPTNLPYLIRFLRSIGIKYRKARDSDELIYVIPTKELYIMYKNYCQHFNYPTLYEFVFTDYLIQEDTGITYYKSHCIMSYRFEKVNFEKALTHFSPYFFTS